MPPKPTKRERKDEAKRRRLEEMKRRQRRARMRKVYTWVIVLAAIALTAGAITLAGRAGKQAQKRLNTLATEAGCDAPREFKDEGQTHIADTTQPKYNTNPPTSGNHFNSTLRTGIFPGPGPAPDGNAVHNLEHGHVIIWYAEGQVDRPTIEALAKIVPDNPTRLIMSARPNMQDGYKIAAVSWGHMLGCKAPANLDKVVAAVREFINQNVGKGPEGDRPGQVGSTSLPPPSPTATASPSSTALPKATASPTSTASP